PAPIAKVRVAEAFQHLLALFAAPEQPLVLFLDDLQWADASTLELIEALLADPALRNVLVLGAYRDNEVDQSHGLALTMQRLRDRTRALRVLELRPLTPAGTLELVAGVLSAEPDRARPLAAVLHAKTGGNPFYLHQLLQSLDDERALYFAPETLSWQWDLAAVERAAATDNVVDLVIRRLRGLSPEAQRLLSRAACVGSSFDLRTLMHVLELGRSELVAHLMPSVEKGVVVPDARKALGEA